MEPLDLQGRPCSPRPSRDRRAPQSWRRDRRLPGRPRSPTTTSRRSGRSDGAPRWSPSARRSRRWPAEPCSAPSTRRRSARTTTPVATWTGWGTGTAGVRLREADARHPRDAPTATEDPTPIPADEDAAAEGEPADAPTATEDPTPIPADEDAAAGARADAPTATEDPTPIRAVGGEAAEAAAVAAPTATAAGSRIRRAAAGAAAVGAAEATATADRTPTRAAAGAAAETRAPGLARWRDRALSLEARCRSRRAGDQKSPKRSPMCTSSADAIL